MAAPLGFPPYGSAGFPPPPYQLNDPAYRKNATRDATSTLKAWLNEHRKNPYPTKGEKIMLAIITKMTLTQVSTWFANARRRLKKENKVTWGARAKSEDEDEEEGARAERKDEEEEEDDKHADNGDASAEDEGISLHVDSLTDHSAESDGEKVLCRIDDFSCKSAPEAKEKHSEIDLTSGHEGLSPKPMTSSPLTGVEAPLLNAHRDKNKTCADVQSQNPKPKLWSLAEIATSDSKQPLQSQNCPSGGGIWTSSQSGSAPSASILARPIYYTSPFYGNYANYGNFGQGILRYGSIHKHAPEMTMLKANHANHIQTEQHFKALSAEAKKVDSGDVCTLGPQSYLSS